MSLDVLETPGRLIIVSNRLPVTIKKTEGAFEFNFSSGGLVSGIEDLSEDTTFYWYGWPGIEIIEPDLGYVKKTLRTDHNAIPVVLDSDTAERYYNGFCNAILWPLFHYHPGQIDFNEECWEAYRKANRVFAETIAEDVEDGDMIWIHDYHLMLLPKLLQDIIGGSRKNVKYGFFLHTPFPSSEIYRVLPVRKEILEGVLHCDLVGFHTFDYARHFLDSCARIVEVAATANGVVFHGNQVKVGTFPIGVSPERFRSTQAEERVKERIDQLAQHFKGMKLIVGVDRLDYIKGLPLKLHAFEVFLTQHPEWIGSVVLVQIAVPSRQEVEEYQNLGAVVNELVGRINGRFGKLGYMPIHYVHSNVGFNELVALYAVSDICIVSSMRDGWNLVACEYQAVQHERHGVLILSEFAGVAQSLNGCLVVNPWDTTDIANAMLEALTMSEEQKAVNFLEANTYLEKYTGKAWGLAFAAELSRHDN